MPFKDFGIELALSADVNTYLMNQMVITCTSSTRPAAPVEGMHIWETDTKALMVRVGSAWKLLNAIPTWAQKSTTETVTNSTTLQDDDELFAVVQPNATYLWQLSIRTFGPPAADIRLSWSVPSGTVMHWSTQSPHTAQTNADASTISVNSLEAATDGADIATYATSLNPGQSILVGACVVGSTGGTVQLRWAQTTANATGCQITGGTASNLLFHRVA
ncbi:hypothetical protein ACQPYK_08530 [Streptosporangium sp. CA-135522]|uniref:hypothetical protein n=1 Tax=Streptosporangium sp. CA-135522 TaxID=3240072 RepID=UPI003D9371C6